MKYFNIHINNHILTARIDRTESGNAVNFSLMDEFGKLLDQAIENDEIRVFVLTGTGRFFMAGGDLKEFHQLQSKEDGKEMAEKMQRILAKIESAPFYSIAAVNGLCFGGGCETILAFDMVVASETARFGFTQGRFYLPPGWGGLTRLIEKTGRSKAIELLGGQMVIAPDEATAAGLVNKVFPEMDFDKSVQDFARKFTQNSRHFIKALKQFPDNKDNKLRRNRFDQETEVFSAFWADKTHLDRVELFLKEKAGFKG